MTKILLVEDDHHQSHIMERLITSLGYEFIGVQESEDFIPTALSELPDLFIIDVYLPFTSGLELLRQASLYKELAHIPSIAVTAEPEEKLRHVANMSGADFFVAKPIRVDNLQELITKALQV